MKRIIILVSFVMLVSIFSGCQGRNPEKIKIGYLASSNHLPVMVAMDQGFFQKEGLDVELVKTAGTKELMDALLAGHVDAAGPMSLPVILGVEQNQPGSLRMTLPMGETGQGVTSHILVRPDSTIKSLSELKGKKIGTYSGTPALVNLKLILSNNGLDPEKDVTIVQVANDIAIQALTNGQYEALFLLTPNSDIAIKKGLAKSLVDNPQSKYIIDPFVSGGIVFSDKMVKEKKELVKKIYRAYKNAITWSEKNNTEAKKILAKWTPIEADLIDNAFTYHFFIVDQKIKDATQKQADIFFQYKIISKPVDINNLWLDEKEL